MNCNNEKTIKNIVHIYKLMKLKQFLSRLLADTPEKNTYAKDLIDQANNILSKNLSTIDDPVIRQGLSLYLVEDLPWMDIRRITGDPDIYKKCKKLLKTQNTRILV